MKQLQFPASANVSMTSASCTSLLLGAGFSKWAADLPLASQLFDFEIVPFGRKEHSRLEKVRSMKQLWNSRWPGHYAEQFVADVFNSGSADDRSVLTWYIVRRISEPYIWREWRSGRERRHVLMINENRKFERRGVREAQKFLLPLNNSLAGVITTNYDLLIEYALGTNEFNYGIRGEILRGRGPYPISQWRNPVRVTGSLSVAKLHGSISWDLNARYTDGRRGLSGEALIVPPTPEKTPPKELIREWELAAKILLGTKRLLVFGFAFNPYDEALRNHFSKFGQGIEEIALIDIEPPIEQCRRLWPEAAIVCLSPPPADDGLIQKWIVNNLRLTEQS